MTPKEKKTADKLIERLYYQYCSGVEIDVMDIGKVFNAGHAAINTAHKENRALSMEDLGKVIVDFVQTIRKN